MRFCDLANSLTTSFTRFTPAHSHAAGIHDNRKDTPPMFPFNAKQLDTVLHIQGKNSISQD